jgi:membrane protease YdiL (CAAX protease family)
VAERKGIVAYLTHRHDPLTSLVLTVPVFLLYHLGILLIDLRNGVDLFTELTLGLLERSLLAYVGLTVAIAAGLFAAGWLLRKKGKIKPAALAPVLLESTLLAVVMMITVGWATQQLVPGQTGPRPFGPLEKIVMSAGAGFHEELVFRVGLFAGGAWLLARRMTERRALVIAFVVSSLLFSAIHYVGPFGDPFALGSFLFRVLAGCFLAAVYHFRGFAVAVYTHALYDVMVFFIV